jgi:septum site-determining protein MinC
MAKPIEFKAGSLTAMSAVLRELNNVHLADALQVMLGGMGEFFAGEATIIDVSQIQQFPDRPDWSGTLSLLRRYGLQPVALRGAPEHLHQGARKAGLAILSDHAATIKAEEASEATKATKVTRAEPEAAVANSLPHPEVSAAPSALIVERTIRSGQQVYARGGDLVVLGAISNGAEVIADGNIYCYGPLRGRALAGASGNRQARIFSSNFGPELISIAGIYRTFEKGIPQQIAGHPVQALLRGEGEKQSLGLEPLQLD